MTGIALGVFIVGFRAHSIKPSSFRSVEKRIAKVAAMPITKRIVIIHTPSHYQEVISVFLPKAFDHFLRNRMVHLKGNGGAFLLRSNNWLEGDFIGGFKIRAGTLSRFSIMVTTPVIESIRAGVFPKFFTFQKTTGKYSLSLPLISQDSSATLRRTQGRSARA